MFFSASHSLCCGSLKIVSINDNTIIFLDINFPSLKPLITNNITDIFLSFNNIKIVPLNKISDQFFLNPFLFKNIKKSSILREIKILSRFVNPLINS